MSGSNLFSRSKPKPLPRGGFEKKEHVDKYAPQLNSQTHDLLFRNIYKSPFQRKESARETFDKSRRHRVKSLAKKRGKRLKDKHHKGKLKRRRGRRALDSDSDADNGAVEIEADSDDSAIAMLPKAEETDSKKDIPFFDQFDKGAADDWSSDSDRERSRRQRSRKQLSDKRKLAAKTKSAKKDAAKKAKAKTSVSGKRESAGGFVVNSDDEDIVLDLDRVESGDSSADEDGDDTHMGDGALFGGSDDEDAMGTRKFHSAEAKRRFLEKKMKRESKWLASKLKQHKDVFRGGLQLQGQIPPLKFGSCLGSNPNVRRGTLLMGCVVSVKPHFVRMYIYGGAPAILTLRELSDLMANEIDRLGKSTASVARKSLATTAAKLDTAAQQKAAGALLSSGCLMPTEVYNSIQELPSMADLFKVGQLIRCAVVKEYFNSSDDKDKTKKKVLRRKSKDGKKDGALKNDLPMARRSVNDELEGFHVSIRPTLFNETLRQKDVCVGYPLLCTVLSAEDYGYVMDCGIANVKAFLKYKDCSPRFDLTADHFEDGETADESQSLTIGHTIEVTVCRVDRRTSSVWVSMKPLLEIVPIENKEEETKEEGAVAADVFADDENDDSSDNADADAKTGTVMKSNDFKGLPKVPLLALKPGFGVVGKVTKRFKDGVAIDFGEVYRGIVMYSHIPGMIESNWRSTLNLGRKVAARIVMIDAEEEIIHLTLKPHLVYGFDSRTKALAIPVPKGGIKRGNKDLFGVTPHKRPPPLTLSKSLVYGVHVPKLVNELVKADVRRIAYRGLLMWSASLDPRELANRSTDNGGGNGDSVDGFLDDDASDDDASESGRRRKMQRKKSGEEGFVSKSATTVDGERMFKVPTLVPVRVSGKHVRRRSEEQKNAYDSLLAYKHRSGLEAKVLRFNPFEGEFQASLRDDVINQKVLFYWNIRCGMLFDDCVVTEVKHAEVIVSFANGLIGRIGRLHVAEVPPKEGVSLTSRFQIGHKLRCRVLNVFSSKRHVNMTAKPSLTETSRDEGGVDDAIVATASTAHRMRVMSYKTVCKGVITKAVICRMNDILGYVVVHFYNNVIGTIPRHDLRANLFLKPPSQEFYLGQVITVRTTEVNRSRKRMVCSLSLVPTAASAMVQGPNGELMPASAQNKFYWCRIAARFNGCFVLRKIRHRREDERWLDADDNAADESSSDEDSEESSSSSSSESESEGGRDKKKKKKKKAKKEKRKKAKKRRQLILLPFSHLTDNGAASLRLADESLGLFKLGSRFQALSLTGMGNLEVPMPKHMTVRMLDTFGIEDEQFGDALDFVTDVVTLKPSLMREFRQRTLETAFPHTVSTLEVGRTVVGYLSAYHPTRRNGLWLHLGGTLQLPVAWKNVSDLIQSEVVQCMRQSWRKLNADSKEDAEEDDDEKDSTMHGVDDNNGDNEDGDVDMSVARKRSSDLLPMATVSSLKHADLYGPGDVVVAKIIGLTRDSTVASTESGAVDDDSRHKKKLSVELCTRSSVVSREVDISALKSYCKVFLKNLMALQKLSYRSFFTDQRQCALETAFEEAIRAQIEEKKSAKRKLKQEEESNSGDDADDDESEEESSTEVTLSRAERRQVVDTVTSEMKMALAGLSQGQLVECVVTGIQRMADGKQRVAVDMRRNVNTVTPDTGSGYKKKRWVNTGVKSLSLATQLRGLKGVLIATVNECGNAVVKRRKIQERFEEFETRRKKQTRFVCSIAHIDWVNAAVYLTESVVESTVAGSTTKVNLSGGQRVSGKVQFVAKDFVAMIVSVPKTAVSAEKKRKSKLKLKNAYKYLAIAPMKLPNMSLPANALFAIGDHVTATVLYPQLHGYAVLQLDWRNTMSRIRKFNQMVRGGTNGSGLVSSSRKRAFSHLTSGESSSPRKRAKTRNGAVAFPHSIHCEDVDDGIFGIGNVSDKHETMSASGSPAFGSAGAGVLSTTDAESDAELLAADCVSLKQQILGPIYKAELHSYDSGKDAFAVHCKCRRYGTGHFEGWLRAAHLSDSKEMAAKLTRVCRDILTLEKSAGVFIREPLSFSVTIIRVEKNESKKAKNNVWVTAKPMFVEIARNSSWPRFNAMQVPEAYHSIKRMVPLLGYVDNRTVDGHKVDRSALCNVRFAGEIIGELPFEDSCKPPLFASQIRPTLGSGQTVLLSMASCRRDREAHTFQLRLRKNVTALRTSERDLIYTDETFWNSRRLLQKLLRKRRDLDTSSKSDGSLLSDLFAIGQRIEATVKVVGATEVVLTPVVSELKGDLSKKRTETVELFVSRPEHTGLMSHLAVGKEVSCVILDVDDLSGRVDASIRLAYPSAMPLTTGLSSVQTMDPTDNSQVVATIEHISRSGGFFVCRPVTAGSSGDGDEDDDDVNSKERLVLVPFDTPFLIMSFERLQWYFPVGNAIHLTVDKSVDDLEDDNDGGEEDGDALLRVFDDSHCRVEVAHFTDLPQYLSEKSEELFVVSEAGSSRKPFDTRFKCMSDVFNEIATVGTVHNLKCKVITLDLAQSLMAVEIAENMRPAISVSLAVTGASKKKAVKLLLKQCSKHEFVYVHLSADSLVPLSTVGHNEEVLPQSCHLPCTNQCILLKPDATKRDVKRKKVIVSSETKLQTRLQWMGRKVVAKVQRIVADFGLFLTVDGFDGMAMMHVTNCKQWTEDSSAAVQRLNLHSMFAEGQQLECRVIELHQSSKPSSSRMQLSVRHLEKPHLKELHVSDLEKGTDVCGVVNTLEPRIGAVLWLSRHVKAVVTADFLKSKLKLTPSQMARVFATGTVVRRMNVLSINKDMGRVELSVNPSAAGAAMAGMVDAKLGGMKMTVAKGDFLRVRFSKISPNGLSLFVYVPRTGYRGFVSIAGLPKSVEPSKMIPGDFIEAWVKDCSNPRRIEFSVQRVKGDSEVLKVLTAAEKETLRKQRLLAKMQRQLAITEKRLLAEETKRAEHSDAEDSEDSEESNSDFAPLVVPGINDGDLDADSKRTRQPLFDDIGAFIDTDVAAVIGDDNDAVDEDVKMQTSAERRVADDGSDSEFDSGELQQLSFAESGDATTDGQMDEDTIMGELGELQSQLHEMDEGKAVGSGLAHMDPSEIPDSGNLDTVTDGFLGGDDVIEDAAMASKTTHMPSSAQEFEKLLMGSPNNSGIWVRYAAMFAGKAPERARAILERALKSIADEEENERLNIWTARMNLETLYGSESALMAVFSAATQQCDEKDVYLQFCNLLSRTKQFEKAQEYFRKLAAKYTKDAAVYVAFARFLYLTMFATYRSEVYPHLRATKRAKEKATRYGRVLRPSAKRLQAESQKYLAEARDLMKLALRNLRTKQEQIALIKRFAWLEFECGQQSKARALFESLTETYPKRVSLWKAYAMAEYKFGSTVSGHMADGLSVVSHRGVTDYETRLKNARQVFDRAVDCKLKMKDVKYLFKEYLAFEKKYGYRAFDSKEQIVKIKTMAKNTVMAAAKQQ